MTKTNVTKQIALYAIFPLLAVACTNNEPGLNQANNPKSEQVDPKQDDKKNQDTDDKQDNKNNQSNSNEQGDKPKDGENKPAPFVELSQDEVEAYFGGFNRQWGLSKLREQIKLIGISKNIQGKTIKITDIQLTEEQPNQGSFTLRIKAELDGQNIERSFDYSGFAQTPSAYYFGKNMGAVWRMSKEEIVKDFALDKLSEDKDTKFFTTEYLLRFVDFYTSDFSTLRYELSREEAKVIKIVDIRYHDGELTFKTEYKGVQSEREIKLSLDAASYYAPKMIANSSEVAKYYAVGVAQYPDMYLLRCVDIDTERYYPEDIEASPIDAGEGVQFSFTLHSKLDEKPLAKIIKEVKGFRPLTTLAKDMMIVGNYKLHERLGKIVGKTQGDEQLVVKLNNSINNWIKSATILIGRDELTFSEKYQPGLGSTTVLSTGTNITNLHLYFTSPRFQVVSARREDNRLYVKFRILTINDQVFNNLQLDHETSFHLIQPSR